MGAANWSMVLSLSCPKDSGNAQLRNNSGIELVKRIPERPTGE
ncbi:hypothetical protein IRB23SM22_21800 [Alkalibacterium sp. s-m-22]